jgi:cell division protease FtsH
MPEVIKKDKKQKQPSSQPNPARFLVVWMLLLVALMYLFRGESSVLVKGNTRELAYGEFFHVLQEENAPIKTAVKVDNVIKGEFADGTHYVVYTPDNDPELLSVLRQKVASFKIEPPRTFLMNVFFTMLGPLFFVGLLWFLFYRGAQGGGRILACGKSRARQIGSEEIKVTFKDVAGVDEAKEELQEIIEFLKDPKKFTRLGGKIPKGVLLMGPPGTGKTLLAKAVAGEAGVPFYSISGSDFVEMFVGVGASRVRDLFETAKRSAKTGGKGCIIFIDEIDAVGRQRFAGIGGGHDEREQTLNALLVEMDGFNTQEGVILVAATNRPDVLDPALLRPGRFDRTIVIDRPDLIGREGILKVHTRAVKVDKEANLNAIAKQTPGLSGADLANLVNEAALLSARHNRESVTQEELEAAIERVMAGPERKSRVISPEEKKRVAYHEAGHALLALLIPGADPLHKVSIIPRGTAALGYTMQLPIQDRYLITQAELMAKLTVLLGGRVSEELLFHEISTGAQNDLEVATDVAHRMVCEYGMSEKLGHLTFGRRDRQIFLGRDILEEKNYSEQTATVIDGEVRRIIEESHGRAMEQLSKHHEQLKLIAQCLLEKEVLDADEVRRILNGDKLAQQPA